MRLLKKWLGIEKLRLEHDSLKKELKSSIQNQKVLSEQIQKDKYEYVKEFSDLFDKYKIFAELLDVGFDINSPRDKNKSWAVVCIEGKNDFVNFYNLSNSTAREIRRVLKSFESSGCIADIPPNLKGQFRV